MNLDLTGWDSRIDGVRASKFNATFDADDVFGSNLLGAIVHFCVQTLIENDLHDTFAIAKMDEDDLPEISSAMYPPHHDGSFTGVFPTQLTTGMSSAQIAKEIELQGLFWFRHGCFLRKD
jgi:hypothetical protein